MKFGRYVPASPRIMLLPSSALRERVFHKRWHTCSEVTDGSFQLTAIFALRLVLGKTGFYDWKEITEDPVQ